MLVRVVRVAAMFGAIGVIGGAFGAHTLKATLSPEALAWWQTGAHYLQIHAVVLLVVGFASCAYRISRLTAPLFVTGMTVFTGSLWLMAITGRTWLGAITPIGGALLIAAWLSLMAVRTPNHIPTAE